MRTGRPSRVDHHVAQGNDGSFAGTSSTDTSERSWYLISSFLAMGERQGRMTGCKNIRRSPP